MDLRFQRLFRTLAFCVVSTCTLSQSALAQSSLSQSSLASYGNSGWPVYLTQPGTGELPLRHRLGNDVDPLASLAYWNDVALRSNAIDHAQPMVAGVAASPDQFGPHRTSRALAIVHIAMFDALNAMIRRYPSYSPGLMAFADSSPSAAIAQAAHDTLVALYPRQAERLHQDLRADLARQAPSRSKSNGIDIGRRAAATILTLRSSDGANHHEPVAGNDYPLHHVPGQWRPDPVSREPYALGAHWHRVTAFVIGSASRFRAPPPPSMTSVDYTRAFLEVRQFGGDGVTTPTRRSAAQTVAGVYWGYDGTAWIGTPPRLYNQIAVQLARARCVDALELARTLALVNVAIADAAIAVWDSKYHHVFWRPVTGVREASPGTGPTGIGDGNPDTHADHAWTPLGAQASNLTGPDFTPPFPAYPSGHAGLGSAMFQTMRRLFGDQMAFTFVSDEFNGITRDNRGNVRPRLPRSFSSLSQAELENGQSRIYLGVHWPFDKREGMALGRRVADEVFQRGLVRPGQP